MGTLNRALYLAEDSADAHDLMHLGAAQHLQSVAQSSLRENDFLVVDVLLREPAMRQLSAALLTSTVWFDSTNGLSFAAHFDDGLVLESVRNLAQVSQPLSDTITSYLNLRSNWRSHSLLAARRCGWLSTTQWPWVWSGWAAPVR